MSAAYPREIAERLYARPRLCDYGDTDLAEVEAYWVIWWGRRREPVPREFLVHFASWGAYEVERFTGDADRGRELNGRPPLIVTEVDRERGSITLTSPEIRP